MKTVLLILGTAAAAGALLARADSEPATNAAAGTLPAVSTNAPAATNAVPRPPTEIFSDSGDFDLKTRIAIYTGNVRVIDAQMKMTCDLLTAKVPQGGRPNDIVAERNVVIDAVDNEGHFIHATGDKAVYTYKVENSATNETIVLTGHAFARWQSNALTGDPIIWDRINNTIRSMNQRTLIQATSQESATNAAPAPEKKTP